MSLVVSSAIFAAWSCLYAGESPSLFQYYLAACKNTENQPVHLRNALQEKAPSFSEMTLLDLIVPSFMQIDEVAERVLYADVDVVLLNDISTQRASFLYEMLQDTYSHFIYVSDKELGIFIASKYSLSKSAVTLIEQKNAADRKVIEFSIHGLLYNTYHASISVNDALMRITNLADDDENTTTSILLIDIPATLTVIKQQFSPLMHVENVDPLAPETFQIIHTRNKGKNNDNQGGCKGEVKAGISWGGQDGVHFEAGARIEAYDNQGNYVEVEVTQNDNGEGSANARAGHEEK